MELVQIGRIVGPHGTGGHVTVVPAVKPDDVVGELWSIGFDRVAVVKRRVLESRRHVTSRGEALIVLFDGVTSRTGAERLKGAGVFVPSDQVDTESADANSWIGFRVVDVAGHEVGEVAERRPMPAQDVLVVSRPDGRNVMIPVVPAIIRSVDEGGGLITIDPPEGLLA